MARRYFRWLVVLGPARVAQARPTRCLKVPLSRALVPFGGLRAGGTSKNTRAAETANDSYSRMERSAVNLRPSSVSGLGSRFLR
jgi:hypothetical protein